MSDAAVVWAPTSLAGAYSKLGNTSFSSVPTIAEINASSDWSQVFALFKRRANQIYASPPSAPLVTGDRNRPTASCINDLRTAINSMRALLGMSSFSFGASLSAGDMIKASHLTALRSSLTGLTSSVSYNASGCHIYIREDNPFGTFSSDSDSASTPGPFNAGTNQYSTTVFDRYRTGQYYSIPAAVALISSSAVVTQDVSNYGGFSTGLYFASSDISSFPSGWWNSFGSTVGTFSSSTTLSVSLSAVQAHAGGNLCYLVATPSEKVGTNGSDFNSGALGALKIDFGF